ncbi:MAG: hypothetical protein RIE52_12005 [Balneola sp.]
MSEIEENYTYKNWCDLCCEETDHFVETQGTDYFASDTSNPKGNISYHDPKEMREVVFCKKCEDEIEGGNQ